MAKSSLRGKWAISKGYSEAWKTEFTPSAAYPEYAPLVDTGYAVEPRQWTTSTTELTRQ